MRYAKIDKCEYVNGEGIGVSLYVQGCHHHCKGCFNPETWDFEGGQEWDNNAVNELIFAIKNPQINRFTMLGGEPLAPENRNDVFIISEFVKAIRPDIKLWLYTGYDWDELDDYTQKRVKEYYDVCVVGRFVEELKDLRLPFMGSKNQYIMRFEYEGKSN